MLQIDLSHIALEGYPNKGILQFFVGLDFPVDYVGKYYEEIDGKNYRKDLPSFKKEKDELYFRKGYKIKLEKTVDYMYPSDYKFTDTILPIVNEVYDKKLFDTNFCIVVYIIK